MKKRNRKCTSGKVIFKSLLDYGIYLITSGQYYPKKSPPPQKEVHTGMTRKQLEREMRQNRNPGFHYKQAEV